MGCHQPSHQENSQKRSFKDNLKALNFRTIGVPRADEIYSQCQEISEMIRNYTLSLGKLRKNLFNELDLYSIKIAPDTQLAVEVLVLGLQIRDCQYTIVAENADVESDADWGAYRAFKFYRTEIKLANDYINDHFLKIQELIVEGNALNSVLSKIIDEMGFDTFEKLSIIQNNSYNAKLIIRMRSEFSSFKNRVTKALKNMNKAIEESIRYKDKIQKIEPDPQKSLQEIYAFYMSNRDLN